MESLELLVQCFCQLFLCASKPERSKQKVEYSFLGGEGSDEGRKGEGGCGNAWNG